jgi:DNA-binding transcriptional regulator YhcF (GntR family)
MDYSNFAAHPAQAKTQIDEPFACGEKSPSQHELVDRFSVARETIKAALRKLQDERLIVTRQGSGTYVRANTERPVGLRPHVERAFEATHATIDFAGFSGETLYNAIQETLDEVRIGRLTPESIRLRVLISDMTAPMAIPCRAEDQADDPASEEFDTAWGQVLTYDYGPRLNRGTRIVRPVECG